MAVRVIPGYGVLMPSPLKRPLVFETVGTAVNVTITVVKDTITPYLNDLLLQPYLHKFAEAAAEWMYKSVMRNFEQQGWVLPWQPLSRRYLQWKIMHGYPGLILKLTGKLMRSIRKTIKVRKTYSESIIYVANLKGYRGKRVWNYARAHQYGTRKMPQRPFLLFHDEDRDQIVKFATDFLVFMTPKYSKGGLEFG